MDFDYVKLIEELSEEERLRFYEYLAHNLTVSVRAFWSDDGLTDTEKGTNLKWLNEIMGERSKGPLAQLTRQSRSIKYA